MPYVKTSPLESDIQPHFLVAFAIYFLAISRLNSSAYITAIWIAVLYVFFGLMLQSYVDAPMLGMIIIFTVALALEDARPISLAVKVAVAIYLLGIILELIGAAGFVEAVTSNQRGSVSRGYPSFTSEPSYLSIVSLVCLTWTLYTRQQVIWPILCFVLALFSGAITGLAPLIVLWALYSFRAINVFRVAVFLVLGSALVGVGATLIDPGSRIAELTTILIDDPLYVFQDVSAANRLIRSIGPVYLAAQDWFVPHVAPSETDLFINWGFVSTRSDLYVERITNIASVLAYLYGIFALPLLFVAWKNIRTPIFVFVASIYLVFTNISIATPYVCIVLSLLFRAKLSTPLIKSGYDQQVAPTQAIGPKITQASEAMRSRTTL
ncbi:MAG: hypothetical protein DI637_13875 [Citromicrobium sp.]|nr:MAG: hypothetical protein DI637_13875 [Citromicrobium sp.]